jgi:hypothetical protein
MKDEGCWRMLLFEPLERCFNILTTLILFLYHRQFFIKWSQRESLYFNHETQFNKRCKTYTEFSRVQNRWSLMR